MAPRRARIRAVLERAVDAGLVSGDADLDLAVATCTGTFYALVLAGESTPPSWAERCAEHVWRSLGGSIN